MITLGERERGYLLTLSGEVGLEDARELAFDMENELAGGGDAPFVLQLDVRGFQHFTSEGQAVFEEVLETCRDHGLHRLSVVAVSTMFAALFCEMMIRNELMDQYQYLDLSYEEDWEAEMEGHLMER